MNSDELPALNAALCAKVASLTADNAVLNDLPRLIELQRTAAPEDAEEDGWNAGLDRAAEMVRTALEQTGGK